VCCRMARAPEGRHNHSIISPAEKNAPRPPNLIESCTSPICTSPRRHRPLLHVVRFCVPLVARPPVPMTTAPSALEVSATATPFQDCTTFPLITSHPFFFAPLRLCVRLFFDNTPHASPPTPGTHFPLTCTDVRFFSTPTRHTRIRDLSACHPPPCPKTFDF